METNNECVDRELSTLSSQDFTNPLKKVNVRVMRAALYARVSTEDQTLDQQIKPMVAYCEREGWSYEVFKEKVSGAKATRKELDLLLQAVRAKEFDVVMVSKLDRLGRSFKHLIQIIEELDNKDVKFVCLQLNIDTKTPMGKFFLQILASLSELERAFIRERTREALAEKRAKGVRLGRPPGAKDKRPRRKSGYHTYHAERNKKRRRR